MDILHLYINSSPKHGATQQPPLKTGVNSGIPKGFSISASIYGARCEFFVLLLNTLNLMFLYTLNLMFQYTLNLMFLYTVCCNLVNGG